MKFNRLFRKQKKPKPHQPEQGYVIIFVSLIVTIILLWALTINDIVLQGRFIPYDVVGGVGGFYDNVSNSIQASYVVDSGVEQLLLDYYILNGGTGTFTAAENCGDTNWYADPDIGGGSFCYAYDSAGGQKIIYTFGKYDTPQEDVMFHTSRINLLPPFIDCWDDGSYPWPHCQSIISFSNWQWQQEHWDELYP
ncbi:MAG: hypothetical protein COT81_03805 [Candidatus Buchananbacteria bacterium CG10_big_fil_rev_8_21_14_0_10_42_9]|uniref:Uncharacterized protein n=1 Tax=Candidatus Buchananbacteria bacterium CG10_big_fil_rev_8_21_14_0_10_42_9 TaxID=1974526 RepID=A0A2H0W365_9BACT|nr:MAG: hypothetical protein COT81_03805 [Candidatus Buchananbacteria bacterium CG10_big_fil_rev_8_21_14_0_10_42_9]